MNIQVNQTIVYLLKYGRTILTIMSLILQNQKKNKFKNLNSKSTQKKIVNLLKQTKNVLNNQIIQMKKNKTMKPIKLIMIKILGVHLQLVLKNQTTNQKIHLEQILMLISQKMNLMNKLMKTLLTFEANNIKTIKNKII